MAETLDDLDAAIDRFSAVAFEQKAERDRLKAINAELVAALEEIAGSSGKTYQAGPYGEGYSEGANAAFEECAAIARAALAEARRELMQ